MATHAHFDTDTPARYRASMKVALVALVSNLILAIAQIAIGIIGNSQALVADGFHTLSDLTSDVAVFAALLHGSRGADAAHPYGHGRVETAVTLLLGMLLIGVGIFIAIRSGTRLMAGTAFIIPAPLTLWVALITLGAKEGLYQYTIRTARRFGSNLLKASAWHHRSDALSSLVVVIGIGGSLMGITSLDSIAALIVAALIAKIGGQIGWGALSELMDTGLPDGKLAVIRGTILGVPGVRALHLLRTRRVGGHALVDVHIMVDERASVSEGHQIAETARAALIRAVPEVADAMVHIDVEDDIGGGPDTTLPLRDEFLRTLNARLVEIPEACRIEHTRLHYVGGRIDVDLLLPMECAPTPDAAREVTARLRDAVSADHRVGQVEVHFRG